MKSDAIDLLRCLKEVLMRCAGRLHGKHYDFSSQHFVCTTESADYLWSFRENKDDTLSSSLIIDTVSIIITKFELRGGLMCKIAAEVAMLK